MLENRDEKPCRKAGLFRRALGRIGNVMLMPVRSFPGKEVAEGGRLIGGLVDSVKRGRRRAGGRFRFHEDGGFDVAASAFLHGISVLDLERRLAEKRRQTARIAYVCFALGWVSFGAWLWRAATMPWTVGHVLPAVVFAPFCLIFFLAAFQSALRNYQIRMRRAATLWEYLKADDFWPG